MHVILFLNHQCNLGCTYCYNGRKFDAPISDEILKKGIDLAFTRPNPRISFFGGEPLLAFDQIAYAVDYTKATAKQHDTGHKRFSTTVNGTLLDDEKLRYFKEENFHILISLDGDRQAHDATRPWKDGSSSFDQTLAGLQRAMEVLPYVRVASVVDPRNVQFMDQSFDFILGLGIDQLSFNFNYDGEWDEPTLAIYREKLRIVGDRYVEAYRQGVPLEFSIFESKIKSHLNRGYRDANRCKFGDGELTVTPRGNLYPCERLVGDDTNDELRIGHIDTGIDLEKVVAFGQKKNTLHDDCRDCQINDRCIHWCGCVNYATTGTIGDVSGLLCEVEQAGIEEADRVAGILFREKNPTFLRRFYGDSKASSL